jgi:isopropylmalate/homocitrate/citramalate synthase
VTGFPDHVRIVEVGPRDGLQNEPGVLPVAVKVELIDRLTGCGLTTVEAGSFVSPKWVPQMADTAEVLAAIQHPPGISFPVLVPNMKGYENARAAGAGEIAVFAAATETFSQRNINCSIDESIERFTPVCAAALAEGVRVRGYVSCVLGCPYEGAVDPSRVAAVAGRLLDLGCYEVSLGDTIGVGTPAAARRLVAAVAEQTGIERLAVHFHDTYGQALANIYAVLDLGIAGVDSSVAGLGGCPYARGASGNVATEDVVYMLRGLDIGTGIDLDGLVDTADFISDRLGRAPISRVARAMLAQRPGNAG